MRGADKLNDLSLDFIGNNIDVSILVTIERLLPDQNSNRSKLANY